MEKQGQGWEQRLRELVKLSTDDTSFCGKFSCEHCDKHTEDGHTRNDYIDSYIVGESSNFQKRLICLLTKHGVGKIHTQEDIFQFVWNNKPLSTQYGSVSQVIYKTKKQLNSDWDIGNFRGKGYFLYCVNLDEIVVKV